MQNLYQKITYQKPLPGIQIRFLQPQDIIKYLDEGGDIHANDEYCLKWALQGEVNNDVVEILIERGADIHFDDEYPLKFISKTYYVSTARILLKHGANVNIDDGLILSNAICNANIEMINLFLCYGAFVTDLHISIAITERNNNIIKFLLEMSDMMPAQPDKLFIYAIETRDEQLFNMLIKRGAALDTSDDVFIKAVEHGSVSIVRKLLSYGANPNAHDGQALMKAIDTCNAKMVEVLLENGADVDVCKKWCLDNLDSNIAQIIIKHNARMQDDH